MGKLGLGLEGKMKLGSMSEEGGDWRGFVGQGGVGTKWPPTFYLKIRQKIKIQNILLKE